MENVPSPLQIGSPVTSRKPSTDYVPTALRVGSPAVEGRPRPSRQSTTGSERLSQLFPSRPPSAVSSSPGDTPSISRRTSFPSPLVPAAEPSYRIPRAPAPPTLSEDTSYNPHRDPFDQKGASPAFQSSSGTKSLLSRLSSLRTARSKGADYNKLDDEESGLGRRRLNDVEELDEPIGYDLSGFDGVPMKKFQTQKKMTSAADAMEQERDLNEAGYAAEFERLEAQLGAGMTSIVEKPFTHNDAPTSPEGNLVGHRRGLSNSELVHAKAKDAQLEAEKTGDIVAMSEIPVDISDTFGGGDFETRSILTTGAGHADKDDAHTSYYFPPDPDMPSWRPFSMGWPWISVLIFLALGLAGLQEYLCQLSMKRVRDDPNGGLKTFYIANDLTVAEFFTWKYAPIMFFVFYGILWQFTDFEVKRLEPFYQLSKKTGATAGESLNMDYLTFMSWLVPLRALRHKQFAVIYSSLGTLIASSLVPVLQSASVIVHPPKKDRNLNDLKSIRIDPPWSRGVSASLVVVAVCGSVLMYEMRRKSGLLSDPKGIAGIATMATKSHILADFRGLDTAPLDKIHKQLRHRRYILHKSSLWQGEYIRNSKEKIREVGSDPRPLMLRLSAGVPFISYIALYAVAVPVFMFVNGAAIATEKLPFLLTALATVIRILWNTINCDVRMLEPFFLLAKRRAPAKTLTLDYNGTNPLLLPFEAIFNRHYLVALVGFGSILAEILTVCVSSISVDGKQFMPSLEKRFMRRDDNDDDHLDKADASNFNLNAEQTLKSFWASFILTMFILLYLIGIACLAYSRRSHKFMPRQIGTMASVLAFIHQSKMLVNFVDTEKLTSRQMTSHLENQGKTYALGWFTGRDGEDHCGIDEEPILAEYRYGVDFTKTRMQGHQIGTWEQF